jgi:hypothetical protein
MILLDDFLSILYIVAVVSHCVCRLLSRVYLVLLYVPCTSEFKEVNNNNSVP